MSDREKVIEALEICAAGTNSCNKCPMKDKCKGVSNAAMVAAIKLLKEQETEWEHLWDAPDGTFKGRCKKCGFVHFFIEGHDTQYKFCPECGRKVKCDN